MLERPIWIITTLEGYDRRIRSTKILGHEFLDELDRSDKIYENNEIIGFYLLSAG